MALNAFRVLIDCDYFGIHQDGSGFVGHAADVVSGEERSGENGPQGHVREVFVVLHAAVATMQHVGVGPLAGSGEFFQAVLREADDGPAVVSVGDVAGGAPKLAAARTPGHTGIDAPM